ncbi:MAG: phosphotransferase [Armatimonadota bacterium]|nr:MAG: phosphotransferase [Armatimonadota bacterium]
MCASGRAFALRQFNPCAHPDDLRAQFLLTELMCELGLRTPVPVAAKNGQLLVEVRERLWALFPWVEGRPGRAERAEDMAIMAAVQGDWVACADQLKSDERWPEIVACARKYRQRKPWAWVVPLDQVPSFARQQRVIERARTEGPLGINAAEFASLVSELERAITDFEDLLVSSGVREMPHTVTHGDLWPSNIVVDRQGAVVLDLDCYSLEPRVTDFARAASLFLQGRSGARNAHLFQRFQARARLSQREADVLPLMMCAFDLYHGASRLLLLLAEPKLEDRARLVPVIRSDAQAAQRCVNEGDLLRQEFLGA